MREDELKPCPFCGEMPEVDGRFVQCYLMPCDARHFKMTYESWQKRPIEDALQAENEWLKEELQQEKTRSQLNLEAEERRMLNITYYCAEIDRLNARIAELESAQRWIPVGEPPKINGTYLLRNIYEDVYSCDFIADTNTWVLSEYDSITHWMPLPKPPEVQE